MEEQQFTNHSEEMTYENYESEVSEQDTHEQIDTQQETPPEETIEYDIIKYNKSEEKIPASERQKYLQMGLHYERKVQNEYQTLQQQNAYLDRLAQMSGYQNTDQFIQAVEQAEEQMRIQQEARRLGIDENAYRQYIAPVNSEVQQLRSELYQVRYQETTRQIENEVQTLQSKYADFDKYLDQTFELAIKRGLQLEEAYRLASYEDRINTVTKQTEQETIRKLQQNAISTPGALGQESPEEKYGFSSMSKEQQRAFIEKVKRGEIQ